MEEMNTMNQDTQTETMGNETEVQGSMKESKEKEQKLFTQEEVNSFVQSRISRMRGQATKEARAEYDQKLADLQAREMKLMVKEQLSERGMPKELAEIITCTDEEDLNHKLDTLKKIYGDKPKESERSTGFRPIGAAASPNESVDPLRKAMGLDKR